MKIKSVLRFYFSAESLERAFDNIILSRACACACSRDAVFYAEQILRIIGEKHELSKIWNYLDGVIITLSDEDKASLKGYADMRCGVRRLSADKRKSIKRALVKFTRKARRLESFNEALGLVGKYYCLINAG